MHNIDFSKSMSFNYFMFFPLKSHNSCGFFSFKRQKQNMKKKCAKVFSFNPEAYGAFSVVHSDFPL